MVKALESSFGNLEGIPFSILACVFRKNNLHCNNLQPEQITGQLVNFNFNKSYYPFETISLTTTQKDKDNTFSEIDFTKIWIIFKKMHNVLSC